MSSVALNLKPEEISSAEKRGKYTVSIVGCEQIGAIHAILFAEAGFRVVCTDPDQTIVHGIARGKAGTLSSETANRLRGHIRTGQLSVADDVKKAISQSNIVVITTPVKIDAKKEPDYSSIENVCKSVGSSLRPGSLVLIVNFTGLGATGGLIKETLENTSGFKVGTDFGLAYSPFRISRDQMLETITNQQRMVAANEKASLNAASIVLESILGNNVRKAENMKTAEIAALFTILQQDVKNALEHELAHFCEKAGADILEIRRLLENSNNTCLSLPAFSERSIDERSYLLLDDAESYDTRFQVLEAARGVNEETVRHAVNLVKDALKSCDKTMRRARISLLGVSQTPNMKNTPKKAVKEIVKMLEAKGAKVNLYDPYLSEKEPTETQQRPKKNLSEVVEGADCLVVLTGHDQFKRMNLGKLKLAMKMPAAIVDLEGILEPDKIEKEGFIYRGLGRGVWTK